MRRCKVMGHAARRAPCLPASPLISFTPRRGKRASCTYVMHAADVYGTTRALLDGRACPLASPTADSGWRRRSPATNRQFADRLPSGFDGGMRRQKITFGPAGVHRLRPLINAAVPAACGSDCLSLLNWRNSFPIAPRNLVPDRRFPAMMSLRPRKADGRSSGANHCNARACFLRSAPPGGTLLHRATRNG